MKLQRYRLVEAHGDEFSNLEECGEHDRGSDWVKASDALEEIKRLKAELLVAQSGRPRGAFMLKDADTVFAEVKAKHGGRSVVEWRMTESRPVEE